MAVKNQLAVPADSQVEAVHEDRLIGMWKDAKMLVVEENDPVAIRQQQQAAAQHPSFKGTVVFVKTSHFARPKEKSPNVGHAHHWFGNAESYFLIGDALGRGMLKLHDGN